MRDNERGGAAVEMALILPILITLVFGIVEFGLVFNRYISVTHSARDGVRQYSLGATAADAETGAEAASPDLVGEIACTATQPTADQVQMLCETSYDLSLVVIEAPIELQSTALMRKE